MPFTIFISEGVVSKRESIQLCQEISETVLSLHGLTDNAFMRAMVVAEVVTIPTGQSLVGGTQEKIAVVEGKVPGFAFGTAELKKDYIKLVTDIIAKISGDSLCRSKIFTNTVYAVDGLWGIAGKAYTNQELGQEIAASAVSTENQQCCNK